MPTKTPRQYKPVFSEQNHDASRYKLNPYKEEDALKILEDNREDCWAMLDAMKAIWDKYRGPIRWVKSPLQKKPWIVAALITCGYIEEIPTDNGVCTLGLTPFGHRFLKQYGEPEK